MKGRMLSAQEILDERIWPRVTKGEGCWFWEGSRDPEGYGQVKIKQLANRPLRVHRLVYELLNGLLLPGMRVCHSCDIPPCMRPDHLWPGTGWENTRDAQVKGRVRMVVHTLKQPRQRRMTDELIEQLQRMYATGSWSCCGLAREMGVRPRYVQQVIRGERPLRRACVV